MKKLLLFIFLLTIVFFSCEKEESFSNENLFSDGGFEKYDPLLEYDPLECYNSWIWNYLYSVDGYVDVDSIIKYEGNYCLHAYVGDYHFKPVEVTKGVIYEISFWYKAQGEIAGLDDFIIDFIQDDDHILGYIGSISNGWSNPVDINWTYYSNTVYFLTDSPVFFYLHSNTDNIWIDNLTLKRKQ